MNLVKETTGHHSTSLLEACGTLSQVFRGALELTSNVFEEEEGMGWGWGWGWVVGGGG